MGFVPLLSSARLAQNPTLPPMPLSMATGTQCCEVCHCVAAEPAPGSQMMNLEIFEGSALLASPPVSFQDLLL
jgi:hypothetical protein